MNEQEEKIAKLFILGVTIEDIVSLYNINDYDVFIAVGKYMRCME